jgi:serine/threonine-protein kinase HipA
LVITKPRSTYVFVFLPTAGFVPAGKLDMFEDGRNSYAIFQYGNRYAARGDAIAVDPEALPLPPPGNQPNQFTTPEGFELFNGIRDAAPDGWGRYVMNKAAPDKVFGEFDYLVASGEHRVGALAFGPDPSKPPRRVAPWGDNNADGEFLDLTAMVEAAERIEAAEVLDPDLRRFLVVGSSLGGARPKAAAMHEGRPFIAKFSSKGDTYAVTRAEFAAMKLAGECGLEVPRVDCLSVFGRDVYLIERFDRVADENGQHVQRVAFVSALTMLGALELASHEYAYGDLAEVVRKRGSSPSADLRELFRRMAFNVLCCNDDDHLRNHGFLFDGKGWRLSPAYDVVPKPQIRTEHRLVLQVGARGHEATLVNALTQCARFGIDANEAQSILEGMRSHVAARWEVVCRESGVPAGDMGRLATCFSEAMKPDWFGIPKPTGWKP